MNFSLMIILYLELEYDYLKVFYNKKLLYLILLFQHLKYKIDYYYYHNLLLLKLYQMGFLLILLLKELLLKFGF